MDSEAKVIITTPALLSRVPLEKLPHLKTVFVVGENIEETDKILDFNAIEDDSRTIDCEAASITTTIPTNK